MHHITIKQNSIKTVSEQYQTTSKTNENTLPNTKSNEKTKRNTGSSGHRGGSNPQHTTASAGKGLDLTVSANLLSEGEAYLYPERPCYEGRVATWRSSRS